MNPTKNYYSYSFGKHRILQTPCLWASLQNYNYMIVHEDQAWIIDPGEFDPIERTLKDNQLKPQGIYLTHHHQDHIGSAVPLSKKYHCPIFGFQGDLHRLPPLDQSFKEKDELEMGQLKAQVICFPGHTLGLCAFYIKEKNWLFSSDLLFSLGCGRVFEGSLKQMFESLKKLRELPGETLIFSSHEYSQNNLNFALHLFPKDEKLNHCRKNILDKVKSGQPTVPTLLSFEKEYNPFLRWDDPLLGKNQNMEDWEFFAEIRKQKDLF